MSCHEQASLRILVAELLYTNHLLRFELSQSQALVGQLRLVFDEVQVHTDSATELQRALNGFDALLHPELGFGFARAASVLQPHK
ncbi:hypothetical protein [Occallatibacter riparius]|uniref:Uncharacterized protein n=1 Tax=Occallatibacter riparius TaxID=1002689 RepID=A0A9J7BVV9_9BACT|nr:hypothetical protein [Occallatibacter riparius]UWZ86839.1 hypothetical protein MOP44_13025 [Occallatibacter riparius]